MKLTVKTLKGTHFEIRVQPNDTIMAVKKNIEAVQGKELYPCGQQLLIHNGKVLKDETTLEENKVNEDGFLVVMLSRSKALSASGASSVQPSATPVAQPSAPVAQPPAPASQPPPPDVARQQAPANLSTTTETEGPQTVVPANVYGQAASSFVAGGDLDKVVNQLLEMGGGNWDRETVVRALRAAYNNPERAVDYLYSGIPTTAEVAVPVGASPASQASIPRTNTSDVATTGASLLSGLPNSSSLDMFPEGEPSLTMGRSAGTLDFLRNNQQFQALRAMVQENPQILQPILQELSKQNPELLRLIQEHHAEFLQLINEPIEGTEGDLFDQAEQDDEMPHAITVTPEEEAAIARLEAMGFDRGRVIEAFLACDRNEQLAANYLLEHAGDED